MVDMDIAKSLLTVGLEFLAPTGAKGVILAERSARGKVQARLSCTRCTGEHVREISDWHQCGLCRTCKPSKGGAKKESGSSLTKINPEDPPELVELKKQLQEAEAEVARREAAKKAEAAIQAQMEQLKARLAELKGNTQEEAKAA